MRGRMKKILALILAANLAVSPVSVLAEEQTEIAAQGAETEIAAEPAAEAAQEETASAEAPAEQTPAEVPAEAPAEQTSAEVPAEAPVQTPAETSTEAPAQTPAEIPAEAPAQTPAETPTEAPAEAAAQETEKTSAEDGSVSEENREDNSDDSAAADGDLADSLPAEKTNAGAENPAEAPAEGAAQEEEQQILKIDSLTAQYAGDMVVITIVTKNKDYNKLYIGKREDKKKKPVIEGKENKAGTYTFKFKVKPEKLGQRLFFVPREAASDQWYVDEELFIRLPESAAAESAGADTFSDAAGAAGTEDLLDAGSSAETDGETGWDEDWLTEEETEEPDADLAEEAEETDASLAEEWNVDWLSGEEIPQESTEELFAEDQSEEQSAAQDTEEELPTVQAVTEEGEDPFAVQAVSEEMQDTPAPTPTPETEITKLQVVKEDGSEFGMFKISDGYSVKEENGELSITFSTENTSYNGIYLGSKNDEVKEPVYKALETEALFTFTFAVPLDRAGSRIPILLQKKSDGSWYTKQDLFLTIPKADGEAEPTPTPTQTAEPTPTPTPTQTPTPTPTPEPTGKVLPDGVYSIPADGAVTGEAMFKVIEATLTSSGGSMTAKIVLSATGYDYLYMGTAEEAAAADESKWIKYSEELKDYYSDADGKTQDRRVYEIPVEALDVPLPVASHSAKKGTWTDRTITFISDKAVRKDEAPTPTPGENPTPTPETSPSPTPGENPTPTPDENPTPTPETSPSPTPGTDPTPTPGEDVGGTTDPVDNSTALADGSYAPQNFTFEGGTGKTTISCTEITVKDGKAFATIVFSSDKFQYVKANGEIFENPVVENGTAAFTIPVVLNQKNRILAMTMAMGTPHEVEYYITADYEQQASDVPADGIYQAETKVDSTSGMFRVIDSRLTVKDGEMTAVILLSGSGYDYLYLGTKEEAAAAKKSEWIPVKKTYSNYYSDYDKKTQDRCSYEIPVSALDTPIALAARSKEKKEWYDRTVTFLSEGLKKTDSAEFPDNTVKPTPTPTPDNGNGSGNSGNSTGGNNSGSGNGSNTGSGNSGTGGSGTGNNTGSTGTGSGSNSGSTGSGSGGSSAGGLNGSTGATGSTTLADGEYTPDSFSFSGGTGKTTITCTKITVKNGQAYATIVFDSDKYQYVKAGGTKVTGSQGGGTSTFEIPVTLNANNTIYAMTTAMSQPHEIQYTLYIGLNAAKGTTAAGGGGSSDGAVAAEEEEGGQTKPLGTISEDRDAPEIAGLTYEGSLDRDYAENFKIHYYENDFIVLEIDVANNTGRTDLDEDGNVIPEEAELAGESDGSANEAADTSAEEDGSASETEDKSFYRETTVKYLLVPEDAEIPAGIDKEMMILHRPVKKAYVDSSNALNILDRMGVVESIAAVGFRQEECKVDSVAGAMERGDILFAGSFEAPQFRDLVTAECDLAIVPEEILPEAAADEVQAETLSADDETQAEETAGQDGDTSAQDDKAQADDASQAEETAGQDGDTSVQDDKAQAGDVSQAETAAEMQDDMRAEAVAEQTKKMQELGDRFALLDIPMIIDRSSAEEEKLGQYEWCKVYGLLFGSEETAVKLYENAVKAMATWETRERPTMQNVELNESAESASDETQGE